MTTSSHSRSWVRVRPCGREVRGFGGRVELGGSEVEAGVVGGIGEVEVGVEERMGEVEDVGE